MEEQQSALSALGLTSEQVQNVDKQLRDRPEIRDPRVCICGHSFHRHYLAGGTTLCKPSKMKCKCTYPIYVLETNDTRAFLRKTSGSGAFHALSRGIAATEKRGKLIKWLIGVPIECFECGSTTGVTVTPVSENKIPVEVESARNAFLCIECRTHKKPTLVEEV
jgi:hypothetical protein